MTPIATPEQTDLDHDLAKRSRQGDSVMVALLLAQGANARAGESLALRHAAEMGHLECLALLIPASDPRASLSLALRSAAKHGRVECLALLIPVSDPDAGHSDAIRWAAANGHADCVKVLISVSDPKAVDCQALRTAASKGHTECVKLLIPVSDPEACDSDALKLAAAAGHAECIKLLVPVTHRKTSRALLAAAGGGHAECVKLLLPIPPLQAGDPNSLNRALLAAVRAGHAECVKLIIPGVNLKRLGGDALFCAVDNCQEECFRLLLSALMPMSAQEPALLLAIEKGHANVVALMISHDPLLADLIDSKKVGAEAAAKGHLALASLMLSLAESLAISTAVPPASSSPQRSARI